MGSEGIVEGGREGIEGPVLAHYSLSGVHPSVADNRVDGIFPAWQDIFLDEHL